MNETFYWRCSSDRCICGRNHTCIVGSIRYFTSAGDAARAALRTHPEHSQATYVLGSQTGYKGTAYGLNFNGAR